MNKNIENLLEKCIDNSYKITKNLLSNYDEEKVLEYFNSLTPSDSDYYSDCYILLIDENRENYINFVKKNTWQTIVQDYYNRVKKSFELCTSPFPYAPKLLPSRHFGELLISNIIICKLFDEILSKLCLNQDEKVNISCLSMEIIKNLEYKKRVKASISISSHIGFYYYSQNGYNKFDFSLKFRRNKKSGFHDEISDILDKCRFDVEEFIKKVFGLNFQGSISLNNE